MRIAIAGSHGVGKTTLAKALAEKLKLPRIEEVARTVATEFGFENNEQITAADKDTLGRFQRRIFFRQMTAEDELEAFVSDRSIFDVLAYMYYYGLADLAREFRQFAIQQSLGYDQIIYCPVPAGAKTVENDGFRLTDRDSQSIIAFLLTRMLKDNARCKVLYLPEHREEWQAICELIILNKKENAV